MKLSPAEHKEVSESLEVFGMAASEQKAYTALLGMGQSTATPLAKSLQLPTTTIQSILHRLAKRGTVHVSKRGSRSVYEAKDPRVLKQLAEQTLREVTQAIPLLERLRSEAPTSAKIRIYGRGRATDVFLQALSAKDKTIYEIVSARDLQTWLGEKLHFSQRRISAGVHLKSLRVEAHEIKKYSRETHVKELREAKFLPHEMNFRSSILFWDDEWVAFFSDSGEGQIILAHSKSMALMIHQLFDLLWSVSRRMETGDQK
ncbi:MAG: helix-turn-helix domain-containing protein [Patescibacteria group bacterium]|jgi:sugar-specific transcriptional regulator TrmB